MGRGSAGRDGAAPGASPPLQQPPELWGRIDGTWGELPSTWAAFPNCRVPFPLFAASGGCLGCPAVPWVCGAGSAPSETSGLCCCFRKLLLLGAGCVCAGTLPAPPFPRGCPRGWGVYFSLSPPLLAKGVLLQLPSPLAEGNCAAVSCWWSGGVGVCSERSQVPFLPGVAVAAQFPCFTLSSPPYFTGASSRGWTRCRG